MKFAVMKFALGKNSLYLHFFILEQNWWTGQKLFRKSKLSQKHLIPHLVKVLDFLVTLMTPSLEPETTYHLLAWHKVKAEIQSI